MLARLAFEAVVGQVEPGGHAARTLLFEHRFTADGIGVIFDEHHTVGVGDLRAYVIGARAVEPHYRRIVVARDQALHWNKRAVTHAGKIRVDAAATGF